MASGEKNLPQIPNVMAEFQDIIEDLNKIAGGYTQTQLMTVSVPREVWDGAAKAAYTRDLEVLKGKMEQMRASVDQCKDCLKNVKDKVSKARTAIPGLQARWDEAENTYNANVAGVKRSRVTEPMDIARNEYLMQKFENDRDAVQQECLKEYKKYINDIDEESKSAANKISALMSALVPPHVRKSRSAIGAAYLADMPLVGGQARWDYAHEAAPHIAKVIEDKNLTVAKVKKLMDAYGYDLGDPFVAAAVSERVGTEKILECSLRLSALRGENRDLSEKAMCSMGTMLALYSGGSNLDGMHCAEQNSFETVRKGLKTADGRSLAEVTQARMEELKAVGRKKYSIYDYVKKSTNHDYIIGYDIFSQMTGFTAKRNPNLTLGGEFFSKLPSGPSVAHDIVAWDNEVKSWSYHMGYGRRPILFTDKLRVEKNYEFRDAIHSMLLLMDRPEYIEKNLSKFPRISNYTALIEAENRRFDSLQRFMTSHTTFDVDVTGDGKPDHARIDMTRYLTGHRQSVPVSYYSGFQDGGEIYGKVIKQLSAPGDAAPEKPARWQYSDPAKYEQDYKAWEERAKVWKGRNSRATEIAGGFLYGYQEGLESPAGGKVNGQDAFGYYNKNLRSWAGMILAPHIDGITASMQGHYSNYFGTVDGAFDRRSSIQFGRDFARRITSSDGVFVDMGFDSLSGNAGSKVSFPSDTDKRPPAMDAMLAVTQEGYSRDMEYAIISGKKENVTGVINKWAPMVRTCFTAPKHANIEVFEELEKRNQRWQKDIKNGFGAIPYSNWAGKGVSYILDQGQKVMLPNVLENYLPTNAGYQARLDGMKAENTANTYMKQVLYSTIAEHGDFNHSEDGKPSEAKLFTKNNDSLDMFINNDGKVVSYDKMTIKQKKFYEDSINPQDTGLNKPKLGEYRNYFIEIDNALNNRAVQYLQERDVKKS